MLCKGSERRSPLLLLYKRGSGWVLLRRGGPGHHSACLGKDLEHGRLSSWH